MKALLVTLGLEKIDCYTFKKSLSGGQASATFLYEDTSGNKVVVKMLIAPRNEDELKVFNDESEMLKTITEHIKVNYYPKLIHEIVKHHSFPVYYFIMEYIEGITLAKYIEKNPLPWDWTTSVRFMMALSGAIGNGSLGQFVHRDLHPYNIMLLDIEYLEGRERSISKPPIMLMDLGCHKDLIKDHFGEWYEDKFRHKGALSTWSPEFLNDPSTVDYSHDIWALGVLFYRLLTNEFPVNADSFGQLFKSLIIDDINFNKIDTLKSPFAVKLLAKNMLEKDSKKRLLTNGVNKVCSDLIYMDLSLQNESYVKRYFEFGADISICIRCGAEVANGQPTCKVCGAILNGEAVYSTLNKLG